MKSSLLILVAVVASTAWAQRRPPNYSQEYMPDTSFDCRDKILGGYYADIETDCQMFHVCVKVPGVGVQDFRFLCPNETSFDQENQICASWYEVDCEANVLFYSDNFDLYRIGYSPSSAALPSSSSANPIPLGPSTVRPAAARPRARPQQPRPQQQRPQEDEEEFYLQRSDTGDRRLQQQQQQGKDLRSSSSSYYGRNKGKVEEEYGGADAYLKKTAKPYKPAVVPTTVAAPTTAYVTDNPTTLAKKKVAVRKLRKRPQQQQIEDATTVASTFDQQGSAYRGQQAYNSARNYDYSATSTTTRAPASTYSAYTPRYNTIQRGGGVQPTTQSPASYAAYDATYQQPAGQTDYGVNSFNVAQRSSLPTTYAPAGNYQTVQRKAPDYSTTTTLQTSAPNNYYQGSYQSTPNYQASEYTSGNNYNYDYYTQASSSPAPSYDQYNYQTAARGTGRPTPSTPATTTAYDAYQTTSEAYKYKNDNYNYQRTVQAQFSAQPAYQQGSGADQESLRTAQSSNYGPSSFNNYPSIYDNKASNPATINNYNTTDKYYTTAKSSPAFTQRSVAANTYTSAKPAPSYEYSPQPSTAAPPRPFSAAAASSRPSTAAASTIRSQQPVSSTTQVPSTKSPKDVSYDYAYYDEGNTEYDGLDPISDHHFGKGKDVYKVSRSVKN